MVARLIMGILLWGEHILPRTNLLHQSLIPVLPVRGMAKRKGHSTEKGKNFCERNRFLGGCFQRKEPYRREQKKPKGKRCRDPCKDGACRPSK
ncbi:uncharacterized protein LOC110176161 [Drosophila serrata]|uniref:uncharacterized protein LOC110176161 n=1 Tax=Drosophila serrata TaxID=7274 RepID=UPI000A1D3671|nr:uncharacterized protein LOC110176161 [Drosophila serrata]